MHTQRIIQQRDDGSWPTLWEIDPEAYYALYGYTREERMENMIENNNPYRIVYYHHGMKAYHMFIVTSQTDPSDSEDPRTKYLISSATPTDYGWCSCPDIGTSPYTPVICKHRLFVRALYDTGLVDACDRYHQGRGYSVWNRHVDHIARSMHLV